MYAAQSLLLFWAHLTMTVFVFVNGGVQDSNEEKVIKARNLLGARKLATNEYPVSELPYKPTCGACKIISADSDDGSLGFSFDNPNYDNERADMKFDDDPFYIKVKCNNPNGCDQVDDDKTDDRDATDIESIRVKFGENVCASMDYYSEDTFEEQLQQTMARFKISARDKTEVRSWSLLPLKGNDGKEFGCGEMCAKNGRNPRQCKKNGCKFIFGRKQLASMPPDRKALCKDDLGCREHDDCNFKCQEFCEMNGACAWNQGECGNKRNFVAAP